MITKNAVHNGSFLKVAILVLLLISLPGRGNAATTYVNMCIGQSYTASVPKIKDVTYQWQISIKSKLGTWGAYMDIYKATSNTYTYDASASGNVRIRVVGTQGITSIPSDPWEISISSVDLPTPPTSVSSTANNYCPGSKPSTLTLTCSGANYHNGYQWFTACGSTVRSTGTTYVLDPSPSVSDVYYVRSTSASCLPSACASIAITVRTESVQATGISLTENNFCPGTSTTMTVQGGSLGTSAVWKWYIGSTYKYTGPSYTPNPAITSTTTYTVKAQGACNTTPGYSKDVVVNTLPVKATSIMADDDQLPAGGTTILRQNGGSNGTSTTWRWYKGGCGSGSPLGSGDIYTTAALTETTTFYLRGEDDCGNTDCVSKTITVVPLSIGTQPESTTACLAGTTHVEVVASGIGLTYQWKKGDVDIPGKTASSLWFAGASLEDAGSYTCVVSDGLSDITSTAATVTVLEAPEITSQPAASITSCYGETVRMEIVALATDAVTYQWKKNTVNIDGATSNTLEFLTPGPDNNGFYTCYINDACGDLTTTGSNLTIANELPVIDLGTDQVVCKDAEVVLSGGSGFTSYLWSNGEITQSIFVTNKDGDYSVTGTDNYDCEQVSNTVSLSFVGPFQDEEICIVTVDSVTGKNMVVWEKTQEVGIESYNVWREGSTVNDSVLVENVAFDALSVAVDDGSEPESKANRYWITAVDTCGNESERSLMHKTMLLTSGLGPDRINLSWLEYQVEDQPYLFVGYKIFRSPVNSSFAIIDSISSGSPLYPDINPPDGINYYRIAGLIDTPCTPESPEKGGTGPYKHSLSNMDDNKLKEAPSGISSEIATGNLEIYPNPFDHYTMLRFGNTEHSEYTMSIRDLSGKLVRIEKNITGEEIRIEKGSMKPGYYHVELRGEKMYRGKMIIQ